MLKKKVLSSIFIFLVIFSLVSIIVKFANKPFQNFLGSQNKAGIKLTSIPEATVFINGAEVGKTPYQDETLTSGDYQVKLESDTKTWQGTVKLNSGTISVVNRELAENSVNSSGETLVLSSGSGVVVTSSPTGAEVEVDGKLA